MSLIVRDSVGKVTLDYEAALENLAKSLVKGTCLLFLGAGASVSPEGRKAGESMPTGAELSRIMAEKCRLAWHEAIPLSQIAFYYESFRGRDRLNELLVEKISNTNLKPSTTQLGLNELIAA